MTKKLRLSILFLFPLLFFTIFGLKTIQAAVLFSEDFEYGQDSSGPTQTFALPGWKCNDYNDWAGVFGVSSIRAHSGSRSFLLNFLPDTTGSQTDLHIEKDANFGTDIWIQEWIYPAYESGRYSRFDDINKWIYAYMTSGNWCVLIGPTRYTGTDSWNSVYPLPDDHTGLFVSFAGNGCATIPSGQNLSGHYIPMNRWSRLIIHVNTQNGVSPNEEAWIDDENGNLTKVAEHTSTMFTQGNQTNRIKLGTTFPGTGGSNNFLDSWIFVDGVKIATSSNDIDWTTGPDTTPPVRSGGSPSGVLTAGTTQTTLSLATNENATCRYSTTPNTSYSSMTKTFSTTGGTNHSTTVTGLTNGTTYNYYVRCIDTAGNANTDDYTISFSVASQTQPAILIQDNFETDNLSQWVGPYSQGSTNPTYGFRTNTNSYQGSWSFQETIPPNQPEGGAIVYQFTSNQQRRVYVKWNQKWSDPWDPLTASKMIILLAGNVPSGPTSADLQIIVDMIHSQGSRLGEFQVEHSNYISGQTQYTNYRQNVGTPIIRQTNRWYTLETLIDAGTPNGNNGIVQLWIDGQLKVDYHNLNLLPLSSYPQMPLFHRLIVTDYADAVPNLTRTAWYDDITLAIDRIITVAPSAPGLLGVQ